MLPLVVWGRKHDYERYIHEYASRLRVKSALPDDQLKTHLPSLI